MRVLITVNDAYGHVLPLVPTMRALAARGHDVLVACPGGTADRVGIDGIRISQHRSDPPPVVGPPRESHVERLAWAVHTSWPNVARGWAGDLLDDARRFGPDAVLCEPVEHAGRVVAAALGVPLVEHGWGFTLPAGTDERAVAGLADLYRKLGATPSPPALRVDLGPAEVQASDIEPGVHRYRYTPWAPSATPLPAPNGRSRVLLTLGTFPHPSAADRLRIAANAAAEADAELVVVLGHDDRGDRDGLPEQALVARWVHLPSELARCALVMHHGGAGTAWATLAAGVPAVCLPQAGDQFRNARLLAAADAAVVVPPDTVEPRTLPAVVRRALRDEPLVTGAAKVRQANGALSAVDALADRIGSLVH